MKEKYGGIYCCYTVAKRFFCYVYANVLGKNMIIFLTIRSNEGGVYIQNK